jgi:hypothetical protein
VALLTGLLLLNVYLLAYSGRLHSIDEYSIFAVTESLAKSGQPTTNQLVWAQWGERSGGEQGAFGLSGDLYSKKGPATSLVLLAPYLAGKLLPGMGRIELALLTPAVIMTLTALVLFACARSLGYSDGSAVALALIFGLATPALVYGKSLFGEPIAALGLGLALWGVIGAQTPARLLVTGLGLGLAAAANWLMAVCAAAFALYVVLAPRPATGRVTIRQRAAVTAMLLAPYVLVLVVLALYNFVRFGTPLQTGYVFNDEAGFTANLATGLYGLLLSPARSILLYAPVLLLGVVGWRAFHRGHRAAAWLCLGIVVLILAITATWWQWWGGYGWGPRLLVPILPFLILPALPVLADARRPVRTLALALVALSVGVQMLGALIDYGDYEVELARRFPDDGSRTFTYMHGERALTDWRLSPLRAHAERLAAGPHDVAWWPAEGVDSAALAPGLALISLLGIALVAHLRGKEVSRAGYVAPLFVALTIGYSAFVLLRYHARPLESWRTDYDAIIAHLRASTRPDDAIIAVAPEVGQAMMDRYATGPPVYGIGYYPAPRAELTQLLALAQTRHARLWLVTWLPPAAPDNWPEHTLLANGYPFVAHTLDGLRVAGYLTAHTSDTTHASLGRVGEFIRLVGANVAVNQHWDGLQLAVRLTWQADATPQADYQVFAHLAEPNGELIAQFDHTPAGSLRPTSGWRAGERIDDRFAFDLPGHVAGPLVLRIGLYTLATGERLPTYDASGIALPGASFEIPLDIEPTSGS